MNEDANAPIEENPLDDYFPDESQQALVMYLLGGELEDARAILEAGVDIDQLSDNGWTPLTFSMIADQPGLFDDLIGLGASVDRAYPEIDGYTPLLLATGDVDPLWVKRCLDAGADVNHAAADGDTALILACAGGNREAVEILLQQGARVDQQGHGGTTALHEAAKAGDEELVRHLLKQGADTRIANERGETAAQTISEHLGRHLSDLLAV